MSFKPQSNKFISQNYWGMITQFSIGLVLRMSSPMPCLVSLILLRVKSSFYHCPILPFLMTCKRPYRIAPSSKICSNKSNKIVILIQTIIFIMVLSSIGARFSSMLVIPSFMLYFMNSILPLLIATLESPKHSKGFSQFLLPNMHQDVRSFVASCHTCQQLKSETKRPVG